MYYRGLVLLMLCVDACILASCMSGAVKKAILDTSNKIGITEEGDINNFLEVTVTRYTKQMMFTLAQSHLMKQVIDGLRYSEKSSPRGTPHHHAKVLHKGEYGRDFNRNWSRRSLIGKLNFINKSTQPDIACRRDWA